MSFELNNPNAVGNKSAFDISQNEELPLNGPEVKEISNSATAVSVKTDKSPQKKKTAKSKSGRPTMIFEPMSIEDLKSRLKKDLEDEAQRKREAIRAEIERRIGLVGGADQDTLNKVDQIMAIIYQTKVLCAPINKIHDVLNKLSETTRGVNRKEKKKTHSPNVSNIEGKK